MSVAPELEQHGQPLRGVLVVVGDKDAHDLYLAPWVRQFYYMRMSHAGELRRSNQRNSPETELGK